MKKLFFASAIIFAFCVASCKKDRTCVCTTTSGASSASASTTINDTKKNAKAACEAKNSSVLGVTTTCELK